ncbi:immunoglobulin-like domain-containing protein [Pseudomonas monteilii]|uniref:immunoglobulin-like domain-containing protein n=1 Tax=Pseudomonas monteilii TaxID=76759 RepID=UPI001F1FB316|nr:immunoglobulin-like domain-containing protein [Pseudomonas monteilii]
MTLSNGQTITVEAGKTQGSVDFQTPANDVYNNGSTVSVTIENRHWRQLRTTDAESDSSFDCHQ